MNKTTSVRLLPALLGCLLLAAGPAAAQTASSTFTPTTSGTVGTPASTAPAPVTDPGAPPGTRQPPPVSKGPESITCKGQVKLASRAVTDPVLPPQIVLLVKTTDLSCIGDVSGTVYLNTGQHELTRPLVASDQVKMTFAVYPNTPGGYLQARTAMVTVNATYDTTTGAMTSATATIGNFL